MNNLGSFIEGEKDRFRCVRALSRVLVHLNVRCGRCHRHLGDVVRWKTRMKLDFRALARLSAEGPSIVIAIGTSRVR